MKRKILITVVVLAAGSVTLLASDSRAAEMVQNTMRDLDFSLLSAEQVGISIMVVAITVVTIFFRGGDKDKI